jgi:glutathione S-transferase
VLLARYGGPQFVEIKRRVIESVAAGRGPSAVSLAGDRFTRATVRVALRQLKALDQTSPALAEWVSAHDRFEAVEAEDSMEAHH